MHATEDPTIPRARRPPEGTDADLLHRWQAGDAEAGTTLLRRHEAALRRYFTPRVAEPCDLIQQTFLVCTQNRDRIHDAHKFAGFLMGIARRVWLEHVRKSRSQTDRFTALSREPVPTTSAAPDHEVSRREADDEVSQAVRKLPPRWQHAVVDHYWHGRSVAEIAEHRGVAEGTVKSWLARSRSALKRRLMRSTRLGELFS